MVIDSENVFKWITWAAVTKPASRLNPALRTTS
jgi:hypothetical protein